jgi:tetratricopeptide (TPR) repeat protein
LNKTSYLCFLLLACPAGTVGGAGESLPNDNPKFSEVQALYSRLSRAVGDSRPAPQLHVRPRDKERRNEVAWFHFRGPIIGVSERVYDEICVPMKEAKSDCLAWLLAHELAHFHKSHAWGSDFSAELGEPRVTATQVRGYEAEADFFGLFFSHLAGYTARNIASNVLDRIYKTYRIQSANYPVLSRRQEILGEAEKRLRNFIPVYEAGTRLLLTGDFDVAAHCFNQIASQFASREVLNNQAVALLSQAIELSDKSVVEFAYPIELDAKSRLGDLTPKGLTGADRERRKALLDLAREKLEKSIISDRTYIPARVNLAIVYDLLGNYDSAVGTANEALTIQSDGGGADHTGVFIIRAIAQAHRKNRDAARDDFDQALKQGSELARLNLNVMRGEVERARTTDTPVITEPERIANLRPDTTTGLFVGTPPTRVVLKAEEPYPNLTIVFREEPAFGLMQILVNPERNDGRRIHLLWTRSTYSGESSRGIRIGDDVANLKKYGADARLTRSRLSEYWSFGRSKIMFTVENQRVTGWMLWSDAPIASAP